MKKINGKYIAATVFVLSLIPVVIKLAIDNIYAACGLIAALSACVWFWYELE